MISRKVGIRMFSSFRLQIQAIRGRLQPESSDIRQLQFLWTPVFTGVTTFRETVSIVGLWAPDESPA